MEYMKFKTLTTPRLNVVLLHNIGMSNRIESWILPTPGLHHMWASLRAFKQSVSHERK